MRVKTTTLYKVIIFCVFILDLSMFYLFELPAGISQINSTHCKALIGALSVIMGLFCYFNHQSYFNSYRFVKRFIFTCLMLSFILLIHGIINYPSQGMLSLLRGCDYLFIVLLVIPILYILRDELYFTRFMKAINYIIIIWYIVLILQSIVYSITGSVFLTYNNDLDKLWIRDNRIRYSLLALGNLMIFYNFYVLLSCDNKIKSKNLSIISLFMGIYCNLFVQQTRALEFTMVLILAIMYLLQSNNKIKVVRHYLVVILGVIILYVSGIIPNFIDSFTAVETAKNTLVRQEAIIYYIQYWIQHPLLGMGLSNSEALMHGPYGTYYMSDVGLVGIIAKCGVFAIVLNGALLIRWIKIIIKIHRTEYRKINILLIGLLLYFFVPAYSVSFFSPAFSITVPVIMSIFEFWNKQCFRGIVYEWKR